MDGNAPARSSDEGGNHTERQNDPRWNAKSERYLCTGFYAGALCLAAPSCGEDRPPAAEYDVAAFVWPAYHNDPRFAEIGIFPDGVGEWEAVYKARPKFEGHRQPRIPLWGYLDEADPQVQEKR